VVHLHIKLFTLKILLEILNKKLKRDLKLMIILVNLFLDHYGFKFYKDWFFLKMRVSLLEILIQGIYLNVVMESIK